MKPWLCAALTAIALTTTSAQAEECPPLKLFASIPLSTSQSGRRFYVPVQIAGQDKRLLLDTGSPITELSEDFAKALDLHTHETRLRMYDVTGGYTDRYARAPFKIGRFDLGDYEFMIAPALDHLAEPDVVGIVGADVLTHFDIALDPAAKKLDLLSPNHCPDKVVYWSASAIAKVPVERLRDGHVVVSLQLDGKPFKAILDTGAWNSTIRIDAARSLGVEPGSPDTPAAGLLNGNNGLTTYHHVFKMLDFEGVAVANPTIELIPDMLEKTFATAPTGSRIKVKADDIQPDMLLGMNILRHLHLYIAYKDKFVYLTPAETTPPTP